MVSKSTKAAENVYNYCTLTKSTHDIFQKLFKGHPVFRETVPLEKSHDESATPSGPSLNYRTQLIPAKDVVKVSEPFLSYVVKKY
jgi:hypothetical protein